MRPHNFVSRSPHSYVLMEYGGYEFIRAADKTHEQLIAEFEAEIKLFENEVEEEKRAYPWLKKYGIGRGYILGNPPVCLGGGFISVSYHGCGWHIILKRSDRIEREPDTHLTTNLLHFDFFNSSNTQYVIMD